MNKKRKHLLNIMVPMIMFIISLGIASGISDSADLSSKGIFASDTAIVWILCVVAITIYMYHFTFKDNEDHEQY